MSGEQTQDKWAHLASRYEEAYGPKAASPCRPLAVSLAAAVSGPVLDIACGPGYELALFARGVGIDRSPGMLAAARHRAPAALLVRGVSQRLPFRPRTFAAAYSCLALIHLTKADFRRALEECVAVLRPNAPFFAVFFEGSGEIVTGFSPFDPDAVEQYAYYNADELRQLALAARFTTVTVSPAVLDEPQRRGIPCLVLEARAP
jgi:SAM-dependent methyltransferase